MKLFGKIIGILIGVAVGLAVLVGLDFVQGGRINLLRDLWLLGTVFFIYWIIRQSVADGVEVALRKILQETDLVRHEISGAIREERESRD
jgi:hypothetical protein